MMRRIQELHRSMVLRCFAAGAATMLITGSSLAATELVHLYSETIHKLRLTMRGDTFHKVVTHEHDGGYACKSGAPYGHVERLEFINGITGEHERMENVGIRVRGNTSCANFHKQFRIKLDVRNKSIETANGQHVELPTKLFRGDGERVNYSADVAGRIGEQQLAGKSSFSLRKSSNDPTMLREKLSSEIFERLEQGRTNGQSQFRPVYRVGFVHVYIDTGHGMNDFGIYSLTEDIDSDLIQDLWPRGQRRELQAFQADLAGADLMDRPRSSEDLLQKHDPILVDGKDYVDNKTLRAIRAAVDEGRLDASHVEDPERQRRHAERTIRGLIDGLAAADTPEQYGALVDVPAVLAYMVAANFSGHWDSLVGLGNNDVMVFDPAQHKWRIIAWDLDNTFGTSATADVGFDRMWTAGFDQFLDRDHDLLRTPYRPLFAKALRFFPDQLREMYAQALRDWLRLPAMTDRITSLRNIFTHGDSNDDMWQLLYRWLNHRYAFAKCSLEGRGAQVGDGGWPIFRDFTNGLPDCR